MVRLVSGGDSKTLEYEDLDCQVYGDGRIEYTQRGVRKFGPYFRDHGFDIRKIETIQEHTDWVRICTLKNLEITLRFTRSTDPRDAQAKAHMRAMDHYLELGNAEMANIEEAAMFAVLGLDNEAEQDRFRRTHLMVGVHDTVDESEEMEAPL